ncbi:RHS repeat-associated core domain-containing protein [Pseudomonas xanthosomatis]|uniref:RHS repeat-associated core domain-containing protein n=1 Tax=Pseudomonas xanthosomatis TaxID=2842356 RepID=UPI00351324F2
MDQNLHAARLGDLIVHPPLAAELASALTEAIIYGAAAIAVGAAIGGAVVAVVGTGGAAAFLTPVIAGAIVGAASMLPGGEDKSVGDRISDFSDAVGNALWPPVPCGSIDSGSHNTRINGIAAARAAGISLGRPDDEPATAQEPAFAENVASYAMAAASFFIPVIGLAEEVRNIINPPVTTPADPGTQAATKDTVKCDKHPAPTFLAQGSDKVFINGQPAARVGDKTTCDAPIDVTFSPNVRIGGGTLTVQDIRDGKSALSKWIGLISGMLISRRVKTRTRPRKAPRPGKGPRKPHISCHIGSPVMVATGAKRLTGGVDTDFNLPGLIPIDWARQYHSLDLRSDGVFGQGWSLPYEVELRRVRHPEGGELWIYVDDEGARLELGQLRPGHALVSTLDGLAFYLQDHGITVVEDIFSGEYQVFESDPHDAYRSRLIQLGDRNLNRLDVRYDQQGRLASLVDPVALSAVELYYPDAQARQVTEVRRLYLASADGLAVARRECLACYSYTANGQLSEVRDGQGQVLRRFSYTEQRLMASHTLPTGAVMHYQWQCFEVPQAGPACTSIHAADDLPALLEQRPSQEWRVIRHWCDGAEDYHFAYDIAEGQTQVTDNLGRQRRYYWGHHYELYRYIDPTGGVWQNHIRAGQLVATSDPQGNQWQYQHDELGREISASDPLGRTTFIRYTPHWALPTQVVDADGRCSRNTYDRHGNLLSTTDPLGQTTRYRHDVHGRVEQITDAQGKHKYLQWNGRNQLLRYRDCSNQQTRYTYDENGQLSARFDARGACTKFHHDAKGHLQQSRRADGSIDRFEVDSQGRLLSHTDPAGQMTQWTYDAHGRLVQRTDTLGLTLCFAWDAYGRLSRLVNENGEAYRFEWDALDRLCAQRNPDGGARSYRYDAIGNLLQTQLHPASEAEPSFPDSPPEPPAQVHSWYFEYDSVGRLLRKRNDDGNTEYAYNLADNLVSIIQTDHAGGQQSLAFGYDLAGRLNSETSAAGTLHYSYDALGNLQTCTLPDLRQINHLYYGSGHLHQLNLDGRLICDFERDELHAETLRTQGRLVTRRRYDGNGRLVQKHLSAADASLAQLPLLQKDYHYDPCDNLIREVLTQAQHGAEDHGIGGEQRMGHLHPGAHQTGSYQSTVHYAYGPTERIHGATREMSGQAQRTEQFGYDKAGNLLDSQRGGPVRHNRVKVYQDKRYRYDRFGRLSEKRSAQQLIQRFHYDAEHRLTRIEQQRGPVRERIEFTYDPLGRRTSKRLWRDGHAEPLSRTDFSWQGLRLLQECQDGKPSLYLYASATDHEPLARVDGAPGQAQIFYFHGNLAGLPEQLTDHDGQTVWRSDYEVLGKHRDEWHSPRHSQQQNLRFQGQYLDRETGLHYNTFRFYDPDIGRYTQPDPIGLAGGINLYRYAPNPLQWVDPLGLTALNGAQQQVDAILMEHLPAIQAIDPNASIGYRGSMASGMSKVHDPALTRPINFKDFDVDGFIISDHLAQDPAFTNRRRDAKMIGGMQEIEASIDAKLRKAFPGLRDEPFGFRIFHTHEMDDLRRKGDVQRRLGC